MGTGNGNEVTEPVEVPVHILSKRDENEASKDIAESPTALPERPNKVESGGCRVMKIES